MSEGIDIRHGFQFLSSLVRALAKLLGGLWRFLPCKIGSHMSRLRHLGWNQCSHGLTSRPLESCHYLCLKAVCGVLGYPKGSAAELLDGILKLRYCTAIFTMRFPPGSLPRVGNGDSKRKGVSSGHPVYWFMTFRIQSIQRRGDGKDCAPTFFEGVGSEVGEPRNLFPRLGELDDLGHQRLLEPAFGGNRRRVFPAGQSSRRPAHWRWPI